jgi:hypothetical protein
MLIKCIDGFTRQFGAPADWDGKDMSCGVLPVLDVQTAEGNFMFSAWEPTPPELEALNKGANIILGVRGTVHPVVSVQVAADITPTEKHPDDIAVDRFAEAMKAKLADARAKGRSGWQECDPAELSYMLREHVEKGDPRDVANFCMFLWSLGKPISASQLALPAGPVPDVFGHQGPEIVTDPVELRMLAQHRKLKARKRRTGKATADFDLPAPSDDASPAVAQPVADERVPCEACYGIGSSEGNFDGADGGDCYVCDGTGKVLPLKNERVRFEVAHAGMDLERMSDKDGGYYIHRITQAKWEAWQARAALCQPAEEGGKA